MKERDLYEFDDLEELEGKAMDAAVKVAKDVLSLKVLEENLANHYSRGVALKEQGKRREAMEEFNKVIRSELNRIKLQWIYG
jgi:tetratricopeptide (TPR) repeat protein